MKNKKTKEESLKSTPFAAVTGFAILMAFVFNTSCGVKGKPLPPLEPPPIGTGEPALPMKKDDKKNSQKR